MDAAFEKRIDRSLQHKITAMKKIDFIVENLDVLTEELSSIFGGNSKPDRPIQCIGHGFVLPDKKGREHVL